MTEILEIPVNGESILTQGEFTYHVASDRGIRYLAEAPQGYVMERLEELSRLLEGGMGLTSKSMLFIGDTLAHLESTYGDEMAAQIDGFRAHLSNRATVKTLENIASICKRVPPENRGKTLTPAHLDVIARLESDEQKYFAERAENEGLSVKELRKEVKEANPPTNKSKGPKAQKKQLIIDIGDEASILSALDKVCNHLVSIADEVPKMTVKRLAQWTEKITALVRLYSPSDDNEFFRMLADQTGAYLERNKDSDPIGKWSDTRLKEWETPFGNIAKAEHRYRRATKEKA